MIGEAEALRQIFEKIPDPQMEGVALGESLGRVASGAVSAGVALPTFDNSAMDGYALRWRDTKRGKPIAVVGEQPAGARRGLVVGEGEAVRIFTGAPLPEGADAVVMQEDVVLDAAAEMISVQEPASEGEFVRKRGADICEGQMILDGGESISPQKIAVLASLGVTEVACGRRARAAVVTTGDELVTPGVPLEEGLVYNSNGVMLESLLARAGADICGRFHSGDDAVDLRDMLGDAAGVSDLVVVSGGVSVGEYDFVKEVLGGLGFETVFWRVQMKPGKPFLFGYHPDTGKLLFGLPGNPVSSFVTFCVLVFPAVRRWMGARGGLPEVRCVAAETISNKGDRPHYVRGIVDLVSGTFRPSGLQQSYALYSLSRSSALVRVDAGATVAVGDPVKALWFAEPWL